MLFINSGINVPLMGILLELLVHIKILVVGQVSQEREATFME
jgi:hypothetical protein